MPCAWWEEYIRARPAAFVPLPFTKLLGTLYSLVAVCLGEVLAAAAAAAATVYVQIFGAHNFHSFHGILAISEN